MSRHAIALDWQVGEAEPVYHLLIREMKCAGRGDATIASRISALRVAETSEGCSDLLDALSCRANSAKFASNYIYVYIYV